MKKKCQHCAFGIMLVMSISIMTPATYNTIAANEIQFVLNQKENTTSKSKTTNNKLTSGVTEIPIISPTKKTIILITSKPTPAVTEVPTVMPTSKPQKPIATTAPTVAQETKEEFFEYVIENNQVTIVKLKDTNLTTMTQKRRRRFFAPSKR